ncbi:MAG: RNA polymerase sigma factor [Flammeovirgaceae bacterium]
MTDEQVMIAVNEGDLDKAAILFERYHIRLYNFFLRMTYDKELSHDMTQNVFERLLKYRTSYKYGKQFKSWIFQIARNVRNDYYQKVERRRAQFVDVEAMGKESAVNTDEEQAERERVLSQAMTMLSEEQREVLVLSKYQKMKYEEIADILGCSVSAAKVKAHRAIKKLRGLYFMVEAQ